MLRRLPPAMHERDFAVFVAIVLAMNLASQMIAVAIGWQVYDVHHRAFDLGLVGLLEFAPLFLLALPAGQLTDRVPRRLVLGASVVLLLAIAAGLVAVSATGAHLLWPFLALAAANGAATALSFPVTRALPGMLVERPLLPSALALRSVANQIATVAGPAIGGLLFAIAPEAAYGAAFGLFALAMGGVLAMRVPPAPPSADAQAAPLRALLGGIHFIGRTQVLLGAILLDLFAVLFGGAVALLPVFAQTILHTGPGRPRHPAQRSCRGRRGRRGGARPPPARGACRADADRGRLDLRRLHDRVRPLAQLRAVARGARDQRRR